jgi:hypothetical protein
VGSTALLEAFNAWNPNINMLAWEPKQLAAAMRVRGFEKKSVRPSPRASPVQE